MKDVEFIKGILATLNLLHWKVPKDFSPLLAGYSNDLLSAKNINGIIYFDHDKEEYIYLKNL